MEGATDLNKRRNLFPENMKLRFDQKANLSGLCRLCLLDRHPSKMTEMFPSGSTDLWKTMIAKVTNIEVNFGDGLPALICNLCVSTLNRTHEFNEKSVAGDTFLRSAIFQLVPATDVALPRVYKPRDGAADMSSLCRLCATSFAPIFTTPIFHDNSMAARIDSITSIKVSAGDGLPSRICNSCVAKLRRASEFVEDVGAKDLYLRTELFQVKTEVGDVETGTDALKSDWEPKVKQEPGVTTEVPTSASTTSYLPSKDKIKVELVECQDLQDDAEREPPTNPPHLTSEPADSTVTVNLAKRPQVSESNPENCLENGLDLAAAKSFQCAHCPANFRTRNAIKKHLPLCINPIPVKKVGYSSKGSKSNVRKNAHPLACHLCKNKYSTKDGLYYHFKTVHKFKRQSLNCDQCRQAYTYYASLEEHKRHEHRRKSICCEFCGKKFWTKSECDHHMTAHAGVKTGGEKSVQCDLCDKKFSKKSECSAHMKQHSEVEHPIKKKGVNSSQNSKQDEAVGASEKPHTCTTCKKSFSSIEMLKSHMTTHSSEEMPFVCKICDHRCSTQSSLTSHKEVHSAERPHSCNQCDMMFTAKAHLKKHMATHTATPFTCPKCGKLLGSKEAYDRHMGLHTGDLPFKCKVCDMTFTTQGSMNMHMKIHDDRIKQLSCHICNKMFMYKAGLRKHLVCHDKDRSKPFKCALCPSRYNEITSLKTHIRYKHANERSHECGDCGKAFFNKTKLTDHINSHLGYKPFKCDQCGTSFGVKGKLKRHVLNMHTYVTLFKCDKCDAKFKQERSLRKHARTHLGPTPFVCKICGKACSQKSNLTTHMKSHSGLRPHKCPECDKCFHTKNLLQSHSITHSDERPHKCSECDKCFSSKRALRSHSKTHTGARPHKCPECDKGYSSKLVVQRHLIAVHWQDWSHKCAECDTKFKLESALQEHVCTRKRPKPLVCEICGKTCTQSANLKAHILTHSKERPHKCPDCDKRFKNKYELNAHLKKHAA